ncbi:hypothetical protein EPO04_02900 [Patescibacteria group bacterium]|nr:MAG: hypothetical protein EPO04_02900 [Patescibacteria group bacterium]
MATKQAQAKTAKHIESRKELSVTNYIMAMAAITILVIFAGGYFGYVMVKENIRNGQVLVGKLKAQSEIGKKLENAHSLVDNYGRMSSQDKDLIEAALPDSPDFTQLMSLMETANTSAGTRMKSITNILTDASTTGSSAAASAQPAVATTQDSSGQQSANNAPQSVKAAAVIEGNYSQFTQYFRNLELSVRPIRVQSFNLKGNSGSLKGDITLETFYQGEADYSDKEKVVQ